VFEFDGMTPEAVKLLLLVGWVRDHANERVLAPKNAIPARPASALVQIRRPGPALHRCRCSSRQWARLSRICSEPCPSTGRCPSPGPPVRMSARLERACRSAACWLGASSLLVLAWH
jgi:hypothetical protein